MRTLATELAWVESGLEEYDADNNWPGRRECEVIGPTSMALVPLRYLTRSL